MLPRTLAVAATLLGAAATAVCPTASLAQSAAPTPIVSNLIEGVWHGSYICPQGETEVMVTVAKFDGAATATGNFTFGSLPGRTNARPGAYGLSIRLDAETRRILATPTRWIEQPENYVMVGFTATLHASGVLLDGRIDDDLCGPIRLQRRVTS